MELNHRKIEYKQRTETEALTFCWDELTTNLMQSLEDLAGFKGVPPEVCLRLGDEEIMMHGVLLAALSDWWRKRLDPLLQQDTLIFHNIMVDFQPAYGVLKATRALLYSGHVTIPSSLMEQVQSVTRSLNLDSHELAYSICGNGTYFLQWRGFKDHVLKAIQNMCCNQQCTDVYVVVNGHIIKSHKLVLGASSPVLNSAFQEDRRLRIIHLPDVSVKVAQNLITYMYYGKTRVLKSALVDFHKICVAFQVKSLIEVTKKFAAEVSGNGKKGPQPHVTIQARVRPEAKDLWARLQQYYTVGRNTDLMLVAENKRMLAHKTLFSAICPPIHEILVQELSNEHAMVMITDTNHSLWEGILNIMYRGCCTIVGTAISTVFSYIDLSLFDIEVNEIPLNIEWKDDQENILPLLTQSIDTKTNVPSTYYKDREQMIKKRKLSECLDLKHNDLVTLEGNPAKRSLSRIQAACEDQNFVLKGSMGSRVRNHYNSKNKIILDQPERGAVSLTRRKSLPTSSSSENTLSNQNIFIDIDQKLNFEDTHSAKRNLGTDLMNKNSGLLPGLHNQVDQPKDTAKYICEECKITFKSEQLLLIHMQSHGIKMKPYLCDECDMEFYHHHSFRLHCRKIHNLETLYTCSTCGTLFSRSDTMQRHVLICQTDETEDSSLNTKDASTTTCDNIFLEMLPESQPTPKLDALEECKEAARGFNMDKNFEDNNEQYFCPDCGRCFVDIPSLSAHAVEMDHATVEQPCWICGVCNAAFLKDEELTAHMKIHEGFLLKTLLPS